MNVIEATIKDRTLTYQQKVAGLARLAEMEVSVLPITPDIQEFRDAGIICDLFEGPAPYRPRYITPDYRKFMENGSTFLSLAPPREIWEATAGLLMLYRHVPSITTFPVYIGNIDALLAPFVDEHGAAGRAEAERAIALFLTQIDRTLNDSFCHANIGPDPSAAAEIILSCTRSQQNAVPNITLCFDPDRTPDSFLRDAVLSALETAKPSFANHRMFHEDFTALGAEGYVVASCYNGLPSGGGSHTLVRLNLKKLADRAGDRVDFLDNLLPRAVHLQLAYMDMRVRFLVEESGFFESSFLVSEGLISLDRFTAMFGLVGLAEAVNRIGACGRFGSDEEANNFGLEIVRRIFNQVRNHRAPHISIGGGRYLLHAQVGISADTEVSPGCRIPIGEEPDLPRHILQAAPFHRYFPAGIGDVFSFEPTARRNPDYLVDIIKGAFASGMRYFSAYASDADVVRITGYLVKRSEIERLNRGEASLQDTTALGRNAVNNLRVLDRRIHS